MGHLKAVFKKIGNYYYGEYIFVPNIVNWFRGIVYSVFLVGANIEIRPNFKYSKEGHSLFIFLIASSEKIRQKSVQFHSRCSYLFSLYFFNKNSCAYIAGHRKFLGGEKN